MWDGVTYVEPSYSPIIHEGDEAATVIVTNAGPATIRLKTWRVTRPSDGAPTTVDMQLRPGNTRSVSGNLIRAEIDEDRLLLDAVARPGRPSVPFAALGWRLAP